MKIISTLIISFFLSQSVTAQTFYKDLKESGLIGSVKTITEYVYYGKTDAPTVDMDQTPSKTIINFDKNGRKLNETRLTYQGILMKKYSFDYTDPKKIAITEQRGGDNLITKNTFTFDDNGRIDGFYQYMPKIDSPVFWAIYKYDDKNNRTEEKWYDARKFLITTTKLLYDEKNQIIEADSYDPHDKLITKTFYKYDPDGALKGQDVISDTSSIVQNSETIEYFNPDKNGNFQSGSDTNNSSLFGEKIVSKRVIKRLIAYYP